VVGRFSCNDQ